MGSNKSRPSIGISEKHDDKINVRRGNLHNFGAANRYWQIRGPSLAVRTEEWRPAVMEAAVGIVCIESTTVVCTLIAFNALVPTLP